MLGSRKIFIALRNPAHQMPGALIGANQYDSYRDATAQYHLHPEAKFVGGDYAAAGLTERRHVIAAIVTYIGKEANEWERQAKLGIDESAAIVYGSNRRENRALVAAARHRIRTDGVRRSASRTGSSAAAIASVNTRRRGLSTQLAIQIVRPE